MTALNCYKIRPQLDGRPVREFDQVVDIENRPVKIFGPVTYRDLEAKLYLMEGHPREPEWSTLILEGFRPEDVVVPRVRPVGALLVVRIHHERRGHLFAFAFGLSGRFLLRNGSWERSFGMKVALNLIYEGDDGSPDFDASRLRSVDFKRVQANTVRRREQANRRTSLETFDFDIRRDLLYKVFGPPVDGKVWGSRVGGADALSLVVDASFAELGEICKRALLASTRDEGGHGAGRTGTILACLLVEQGMTPVGAIVVRSPNVRKPLNRRGRST